MGIFDKVRETQPARVQQAPQSGLIWVTMLIEFDITGKSTILRSFSRPAKDSDIKFATKSKPKVAPKKYVVKKNTSEESLF